MTRPKRVMTTRDDTENVSGAVYIDETDAPGLVPRRGQSFPRTARLLKHACFDSVYKLGQRHFSSLMTVFFRRRDEQQGVSATQSQCSAGSLTRRAASSEQESDGSETRPHTNQTAGPGPRIGFTVGRVLGGSVERNRIRRRMREAVRLKLDVLQGPVDVVINPKKAVLTADFCRILDEVSKAFAVVARKTR